MKNNRNARHALGLILGIVLTLLSAQTYAAERKVFYHNNLLGSPVAATDESGNLCWREDYRPYGEKLRNEDQGCGLDNNVTGFTGHVHDRDIGLTYMQARYYDPIVGRFMGVDPVGFMSSKPGMFNRYTYALNNPYKYKDPTGKCPVCAAPVVLEALELAYAVVLALFAKEALDEITGLPSAGVVFNEKAEEAEGGAPAPPDVESGKESDPADKGGKLSRAGRALAKHGSRPGSAFPPATGNPESKNKQGQKELEDIVNNPESTTEAGNPFGGVDVVAPDGRGARFDRKGKLRGFLEPELDAGLPSESGGGNGADAASETVEEGGVW